MIKKRAYFPAFVRMEALEGENGILTGSVTSTQLSTTKENVSVQSFDTDKDFEVGNFGDISF